MADAQRIDTYDLSIEPYEDCCSLWVHDHPATKARLEPVLEVEAGMDIAINADWAVNLNVRWFDIDTDARLGTTNLGTFHMVANVLHPLTGQFYTSNRERMTITDEYFVDQRLHTVAIDGRQTTVTSYPNLLGRLPIVHIANAKDEGDTFGHPEAEALVELLLRYNTTLEAAVDGNERQGRPTPVLSFETVADLDKFWTDYGVKESRTLPDGTTEQVTTIGVDLTQILTVSGAEFQYAAPGSFTQDTSTLLGLMFYLLLEHAEIPEFVFGNAISSSQASANTQMPILEKFIEGRRREAEAWLMEIAQIVLGYLSLIQPSVSRETNLTAAAPARSAGRRGWTGCAVLRCRPPAPRGWARASRPRC